MGSWPGFASIFDADYWSLLPVFLVISAVVAARATSEGVSAQEISRRTARAVDFRGVQRTVGVGGLAVFLSGIAGTLPAISYLPATISLLSFTRVAARRVGLVMGAMLIVLALLPKAVAALITIPRPVSGALLMAILGLLFIEGVRAVTRDGLSRHRGFIVGLSLSVAVGLQSQPSFLELLGDPVAALLGNGVLVGVVIAVLLTSVFEMTSGRRQRFETVLDRSAFGDLDGFLRTLGDGMGWNSASGEASARRRGRDAHGDDAAARGQSRRCAAASGAQCSARLRSGRAGVSGAVLRGEHRRPDLVSQRAGLHA